MGSYIPWNKLLQSKNKELNPAPNEVSTKASLKT